MSNPPDRLVRRSNPKPLFIVFEGIDGAGKSVQARMLADRLQADGIPHILTAEPSDGPIGRRIKSLKARLEPAEEERLFTEDRRRHVRNVIAPALKRGDTVICDRYVHSSAAYQGARGIHPEKILAENRQFAAVPDLIFLLEVTVDMALSRIGRGRSGGFSAFEARSDLEAVHAIYSGISDPAINRMDGSLPPDELHREIVEIVRSAYEQADKLGKEPISEHDSGHKPVI
jgi:dTMP kinase